MNSMSVLGSVVALSALFTGDAGLEAKKAERPSILLSVTPSLKVGMENLALGVEVSNLAVSESTTMGWWTGYSLPDDPEVMQSVQGKGKVSCRSECSKPDELYKCEMTYRLDGEKEPRKYKGCHCATGEWDARQQAYAAAHSGEYNIITSSCEPVNVG